MVSGRTEVDRPWHGSDEQRSASLLLGALVLLFCLVFLTISPSYFELMLQPDVGSQLSKGQQILHGFHPWVQVDSSVYGPAIFYLSALGQYLSGDRLLPELTLIFLGYLASYSLLFFTFSARCDRRGLLLVFALIALAAFPRFHKYHVLLPQAVFLFGLHLALRAPRPGQAARRLAIACVVAGLFRIDFGAYCVACSGLALALRHHQSGWRVVARALGTLLLTGLALVSPWLGFLAVSGDLAEILATSYSTGKGVHDGLALPLSAYRPELSPLSGNNALFLLYWFFFLAPLAVLLVVLISGKPARESSDDRGRQRREFLLVAAVFAVLIYQQAGFRTDISHVKQSLHAGLFALFLALDHRWPRTSAMTAAGRTASRVGLLLLAGFLVLNLADRRLVTAGSYAPSRWWPKLATWTLTRSQAVDDTAEVRGSQLREVLRRTRQLTAPGDAVLFLPFLAQSYYFSGSHFETPHGWWNPGRFRSPGSQDRFIRAMATTRLVVDVPAFTFDGLAARNARVHAPQVMEHIYSRFGLFQIVGEHVLLSPEPEIWQAAGSFPLELRAADSLPTPAAADRSRGHGGPVPRITHVNTLPSRAPIDRHRMPQGAGLLLAHEGCREPPAGAPRRYLGLRGSAGLYLVTRRGTPVSVCQIGPADLIHTRAASPGTYRLVLQGDRNASEPGDSPAAGRIEIVLESRRRPASTSGR